MENLRVPSGFQPRGPSSPQPVNDGLAVTGLAAGVVAATGWNAVEPAGVAGAAAAIAGAGPVVGVALPVALCEGCAAGAVVGVVPDVTPGTFTPAGIVTPGGNGILAAPGAEAPEAPIVENSGTAAKAPIVARARTPTNVVRTSIDTPLKPP